MFVYHFSTMFSLCMNFCSQLRTVNSITYLAYENKNKHVLLALNNAFANILQKVISWAFIRGWYFAEKCLKMVIFRVQIGGGWVGVY